MIEAVIPCSHGKLKAHQTYLPKRAEGPVCTEARRVRLVEVQPDCLEPSPESYQRCVLPATKKAHIAGHESAYVNNGRAVWGTTGDEWWAAVPGPTYRLEEVE